MNDSKITLGTNRNSRIIIKVKLPIHKMIQLNELRLPIDHVPQALEQAICERLELKPKELIRFEIFKRSVDARKNVELVLIYTIHVSVKDEDALRKVVV
jgi:hypothetical protein